MSTHQNEHGEKVNMEISRFNFVRDGATKLPPGFRFQPTDQEIVFQYLIRKVFSCPLPASIVHEIANICKFNPWDLPGDWEQDRYFFSKKEAKYGNGHRSNRASDDGYWKATGFDRHITRCCYNNPNMRKTEIITGMKKTLVFYKGKSLHGNSPTRTSWIMHEYRLRSWIQMGNWVLCHVYLNKRSRNVGVADGKKPLSSGLTPQKELLNHGLMMMNDDDDDDDQHGPSSSSSCGSSVVTREVSSIRKS
ncbi:No apical meristem (NAM) protein [Cynara cardunculus var. scolymus]|uniref:No apical meristem (NAM) protein n=1 Tax=Cynara cardunculus var. scolymus TaxID=59895 RepID=A0A103XY91_CYNCS|nr:No apical meristem (NAM) protein [Cynara cardunculus var. scolymus]